MPHKTKLALITVILLWASAFVGIRAGLHDYSPEGLALLRYLIASLFMSIIYYRLPKRHPIPLRDVILLLGVGVLGIGFYNITLNYGEMAISSGMSSFIISQSPILTTIFAIIFLNESLSLLCLAGFIVSVIGVFFIAIGEGGFQWNISLTYILLATFAGSCYSILQKPFLKKYSAIEATTYVIWGGTLFLLFYTPKLEHDLITASLQATVTIIYLGIFPAAVGYVAWSYVLSTIPASRAVSFLYFMPFLATILGWICLGETPAWISIMGGVCAIIGVWLVNQSYKQKKDLTLNPSSVVSIEVR